MTNYDVLQNVLYNAKKARDRFRGDDITLTFLELAANQLQNVMDQFDKGAGLYDEFSPTDPAGVDP